MGAELTSRQLRRSVRHYIQEIGDSPDAVAGRLNEEGVRGLPGEVSECALARYLQAVVGTEMSVRRVVVKEWSVRVFRTGSRLPSVTLLPGPVARFIRAFDAGCYPELIDGPGVLARGYAPGVGGAGRPAETGSASGAGSQGMDLFS